MPKYECEKSNYYSSDSDDHNLPIKKIKNKSSKISKTLNNHNINTSSKVITNYEKKMYECIFCNKVFKQKTNKYRHQRLYCKKNIERVTDLSEASDESIDAHEINELYAQLKQQKKMNEYLMKTSDEDKKNSANIIKMLAENTREANKNTSKSMSATNYLMSRFPNAPPIESLKGKKLDRFVEYDGDSDKRIEDVIIYYYQKKKLHELLGKLLIKEYRKEDPKKQSVWSSDVSRLTFILRQLTGNNTTKWIVDKNGIDFKKMIVQPLVDKVQNMLDKYVVECNNEIIKDTDSENVLKLMNASRACIEVSMHINLGKLSGEILRYIAPYFNFKIEETGD